MKARLVRQWKAPTPNWARIVQIIGAILTVLSTALADGSLMLPKWVAITVSLAVLILPQLTGKPLTNYQTDLPPKK